MLTLVTPTCDQPIGFALCELYMARQTVKPDRWIVVDDGNVATVPTMGQDYVRRKRDGDGFRSFAANLRAGISDIREGVVAFIEHDDYYAPRHLETLVALLDRTEALAAGDDRQRYYNVAHRCFRSMANVGASLCQTGIKAAAVPLLRSAIDTCFDRGSYGIDATFWRSIHRARWAIMRTDTVVGIKGLPGRPGLGMGHRPTATPGWIADPDLSVLREWTGDDAARYETFKLEMAVL